MPDYHLYDNWIEAKILEGRKKSEFKEYIDYSIGYLTRHCFRGCKFCVNQNFKKVDLHSPLEEFLDNDRKKIILLDDNFLGCKEWKSLLQKLIDSGKRFKFKQGLDERLLTDEKCEMLFSSKYDGDVIFAFDNVEDYDLIESKLKMIRKHTNRQCMFYVLCGFDKNGKYDEEFYSNDIKSVFKRIDLLRKYHCLPYIMRFNRYKSAPNPYYGMYVTIARWCNQFSFFKRNTFKEFCLIVNKNTKSTVNYFNDFMKLHPEMMEELNKKIIW